jgi:hypothetical protein
MANSRRWASWITNLILGCHALVAAIASLCLWKLGDWENSSTTWWLVLTLRIIWGTVVVHVLALSLTRITIIGWYFRRYFHWPESSPEPPRPPSGPVALRPTRAPWVKSGAYSFSVTVTLVSVTGAVALALVVMWILRELVGDWVYWLVTGILVTVWWVVCITMVVTRVILFDQGRKAARIRSQEAEHNSVTADMGDENRDTTSS